MCLEDVNDDENPYSAIHIKKGNPVINIYESANVTSSDAAIRLEKTATLNIYGGTFSGDKAALIVEDTSKISITGGLYGCAGNFVGFE